MALFSRARRQALPTSLHFVGANRRLIALYWCLLAKRLQGQQIKVMKKQRVRFLLAAPKVGTRFALMYSLSQCVSIICARLLIVIAQPLLGRVITGGRRYVGAYARFDQQK
jgi:hypothetical protein